MLRVAMENPSQPIDLEALIQKLRRENFFGELVIKFEAGKPTVSKKTDTIKVR